MTDIKFWLVWNGVSQRIGHRHKARADALAEASRLSAQHPQETFYVLEAVCRVKPAAPPTEVVELAEPEEPQEPVLPKVVRL